MKTLYIMIEDQDHDKFKELVKNANTTMSDIIREFIKKIVTENA